MTLSKNLRAWRGRQGLSQSQAAARLGINVRSIENWEQGANAPTGLAMTALLALITPSKLAVDNCPRLGDSVAVRERKTKKRKAKR